MRRMVIGCFLFHLLLSILFAQEITINEIMYNPVESGTDTTEYIELVNPTDNEIDIGNWRLVNAVNMLFPAGTFIVPGSYLLIVGDSTAMKDFYGLTVKMYQWSGTLRNTGELIILINASGDTIDLVNYDDGGDWPREPNGSGPSLELVNPVWDNTDPGSWRSSDTLKAPFGTPGTENSVFSGTNTPPQITSVPPLIAFIDGLYQYQVTALDEDSDTLIFLLNTTATFLTIDSLSGIVSGVAGNEHKGIQPVTITVHDNHGSSATQAYNLLVLESQQVCDIVINEIMYNPLESGTDTTEYIELFNNTDRSVDIGGWSFIEGVDFTFPVPTILPAGDFLVVTVDSSALKRIYDEIDRMYQWTDGVLVNSGESIVLINALGNLIDSVRYGTKGGWPTEPNGGGVSLELIQYLLDNNLSENWEASDPACAPRGTPGKINSAFLKSLKENLNINELMNYNQCTVKDSSDNSYDSWLELYNRGAKDINLISCYLTDESDHPGKWQLPAISFGAGTFLLIWCDGDSTDSGLHTKFNLTSDNKFLGIYYVTNMDTIIIDTLSFDLKTPDISYGRNPDGGEDFVFFTVPTPGRSNVNGRVTAVLPEQFNVPKHFALYQNYPNPFNPVTVIPFSLPEAGRVKITVYNILGQQVEEVVNQQYEAGYHEACFGNSHYASGIYIIQAVISSQHTTSKKYTFYNKSILMK